MTRSVSLRARPARIPTPTLGATAAVAIRCALIVAARLLTLAILCSAVATHTLGPLAPWTCRRRFPSPHEKKITPKVLLGFNLSTVHNNLVPATSSVNRPVYEKVAALSNAAGLALS